MSKFQINSESSEDTYASADKLPDAIRIARDFAAQVPLGEAVCVEQGGKVLLSLTRLPTGELVEQLPTRTPDRKIVVPDYGATLSTGSTASSPSQ